ncbi:MAG: flagellin [Methanomicrobiales archaeon]|jgi:flagellar protein FlaG
MSSETIVTAIFLITAVVAAGILTSQIFPAIYTVSGTVSSSTQKADQRMRTDIAIVNTFANESHYAQVWLKNVGSNRISESDLDMSTVWVNYQALTHNDPSLPSDGWTYEILENPNTYWDPGETLHITMLSQKIPGGPGGFGQDVIFQIALSDGTTRSETFTVSNVG